MGAPLYDITIYYNGTKIKDTPEDWEFRKIVNYIADFYHDRLDKYKPNKTGRICVHFGTERLWIKPIYSGSICSISNVIDEDLYLNIDTEKERYKYILNLLHDTILEASIHLDWDVNKFIDSYNHILSSDFVFIKQYPTKKSRSRKNSAKAVIEKDNLRTRLIFEINNKNTSKRIDVLEKKNWYWFDSAYNIAKKSKWINNNAFGYFSKDKSLYAYYDLEKNILKTNLEFEDNDL